jgi:flagellar hook assembly protein FlgD
MPNDVKLEMVFPNPFNSSIPIRYPLAAQTNVSMNVYDLSSKRVRKLINGFIGKGSHLIEWDSLNESGEEISSGIYVIQLSSGKYNAVKKIVQIR